MQIVEAVYENGMLRPLKPLEGITEHSTVKITIESQEREPHPLLQFAGILSDEESTELQQIINEEFGKVDPDGW